ncbi:TetR/AcrR family transcriptional regulator [Erythrobacter cryptus]|uniref:TetR/AcrR family transcriptional regulator n=1 Tax=Erythrobacter cryptus TaxID=196588 RepID=UPI000427885A|nr:TetR/AcrR family transcriptional regulator [Erythrobacter cryptus]
MSIAETSVAEKNANPRRGGRPLDAAKRRAIIEKAAHHFFHHGFAATAIEQVAADAGVSKVTIYNQFGDKRALFAAAVECECEKIRGHFSLDPARQGSIAERLTAIGAAIVAFLSRPEMVQFERRIAAETEAEPGLGAAFLEAGPWRMKRAFAAYLSHAEAAGELRVADPLLAAEQFVSLCKGMGDLERRFGCHDDDETNRRRIAGAVEVFLAAYGAAPGAARDR